MITEVLTQTVTAWINDLDHYTLAELRAKPSPVSWSLGQVYFHLIDNTRYYIEEAKICLSSNDHMHKQASPDGAAMLAKNEFPDTMIEGPDTNVDIPQPHSMDELKNGLLQVKDEISRVATLVSNSHYQGKTRHPGLGYFCALDWLHFADMHFRHHLRQKKRIDNFLGVNQ
ncbi:MAG TPA: DinB family protein [Chitinophagaceae bacterium]|jgi:DinB family protein|nr:DinB family protein [Chitinophagaceae bacterium]